jgi:hypothetical protein
MKALADRLDMDMVAVDVNGNSWAQALAMEENRIRGRTDISADYVRKHTIAFIAENKSMFLDEYASNENDYKPNTTRETRFDLDLATLKEDLKFNLPGDSNLPEMLVPAYAQCKSLNLRIYAGEKIYDMVNDNSNNNRAHLALLQWGHYSHYNVFRSMPKSSEPKSSAQKAKAQKATSSSAAPSPLLHASTSSSPSPSVPVLPATTSLPSPSEAVSPAPISSSPNPSSAQDEKRGEGSLSHASNSQAASSGDNVGDKNEVWFQCVYVKLNVPTLLV